MAKKSAEVSVLIKAKDLTATVIGRFRRSLRAITTTVRDVTRGIVAMTAAAGALLLGLTKLTQQGSKVNAVKMAFAKITGDETRALGQLRQAAAGTIDDFRLMALANQALTLGAAKSVEEFAEMVRLSRILGRAQGLEATEALEKFTLALARQSAQRADDLGLQLKGVEASKFATAFMEQARAKVAELTVEMGEGVEAGDRFATVMVNLRNRFAEVAAESPLVAQFFDGFTSIVTDIIALLGGDRELLVDGMKTLGRIAGDAFAIGVNEGLEAFIDKGNPFGRWVASWFGGNADTARENLDANLEALSAIARAAEAQRAARIAGAPQAPRSPTGAPSPSLAGLPGITGPSSAFFTPSFAVDFQNAAQRRARERFLAEQAASAGGIRAGEVGSVLPGIIGESGEEVIEGAEKWEEAGQIAAASIGSAAEAIIRGSGQIEVSLVNMITEIVRNLPGVGGFAGALIGGVGGIFSALFSRKRDPVPVRVSEYDNRALDQMRRSSGPTHITNVTTLPDGTILSIEEVELQQYDRQNRDEIPRIGPRGRPLAGRRG